MPGLLIVGLVKPRIENLDVLLEFFDFYPIQRRRRNPNHRFVGLEREADAHRTLAFTAEKTYRFGCPR